MKYLVAFLLVAGLIAQYEMRPVRKIKMKCKGDKCKIKIKYKSISFPGPVSSDELRNADLPARDVDEINENDLGKRQIAMLDNGLQQLLQRVLNKREEAEEDIDDA